MNGQRRWRSGATRAAVALATWGAAFGGSRAEAAPAGEDPRRPPAAGGAPQGAPNLAASDDTADTPAEAQEAQIDPFAKIAELEARLDQQQSVIVVRQPRGIVGGYIDLGFFAPQGNGSGILRDQGNLYFPQ